MTATANCLTQITSSSNLSTKKSISLTPNKFFPINLLTTDKLTQQTDEEITPICEALLIEPLPEVSLSSEEFDSTSWVESISQSAAGASIMYDKLKAKGQTIPKSTTPRMMTGQEWINLSKCFNEWPFKPRTFENELELALDDSYNV
ncbi:uncharacterized protein MELLADRAFT_79455 [Melampsora larici-populina 98AG31]|uniref:Uncharacterized protein n=1 Tax=Melampsora larici-populina (strain 98AG31 / pathotype 3-4-7) TaxID=747676 RepID=F4S747_MELLP|nr:uncharacterized protein MELLADRAFT_79455 [Melampsora larici-populina 98AG31]EGF99445.1 hypothetical protein MELLADRAFT_79455 [Melampsora larici-populina 98AG31]